MTFEIYLLIKIVSKMNDPKTVPKKNLLRLISFRKF